MTAFRTLTTDGDVDALLAASHTAPVIVFKHSETCGVSLMVRDRLHEDTVPALVHEVVVQRQRSLSNRLATLLGVRHESPQVFVIAAGKAAWHSSHNGVTAARITAAYQQAASVMPAAPAR